MPTQAQGAAVSTASMTDIATDIAATATDASIASMAAYYVQRAAYYERVYHKPERQTDLRAMEQWLTGQFSGRRVLEIACGTGWWTPHAAKGATHWLATDLNPETLALARSKALPRRADGSPIVEFRTVDAYTLAGLDAAPADIDADIDAGAAAAATGATTTTTSATSTPASFNAAFAGCWWSHVPLQRLPAWLDTLHARLEPGARVVMLDNSYVQTSSTPLTRQDAAGNTYQMRTLDDGSTHEVLKNFPTSEQAFAQLGPRARDPQWRAYTHYWVLSYTLG